MTRQEAITKLVGLRLNLYVHPENEPNSEFEGRIEDLDEIITFLREEGKHQPEKDTDNQSTN